MAALQDLVTPRMKRGMERMGTALNGPADEVPVMAQLAAHTLKLTGVGDQSFWSDPDAHLIGVKKIKDFADQHDRPLLLGMD